MKLIIAGSRDLPNAKETVMRVFAHYFFRWPDEIVHGANGYVDQAAADLATEVGIAQRAFPADWETHGKAAGPIRNAQMAEYADVLLAIRRKDGNSPGTDDMIRKMLAERKTVVVVHR